MASQTTPETPRLILAGSGAQQVWEPVLAALAERYEVALIDGGYPTWQGAYAPKHRIADISNLSMLFHAIADLRGEVPTAAVLTWHQNSVRPLAHSARKLRLRHTCPDGVEAALDNLEVRGAVGNAGLPAVAARVETHEDDVAAAGEWIGYPVVLRPRTRGGAPAALARDEGDLREAFTALAAGSSHRTIADHGVVVEQYIAGTELNVHSTVWDGKATPVLVAETRFAGEPSIEVTGYEPVTWQDQPWTGAVADAVQTTHEALGIDWGVTNTRVRLAGDRPHVIGVDTWLTGELVQAFGADGIALVHAAAAIAFEQQPS